MDFEQALQYVERAREVGRERGIAVAVAVHDLSGIAIAVARGNSWHGPYEAMGLARLAAYFRRPTRQMVDSWRDRPLFPQSIMHLVPGDMTAAPGGYPIVENGKTVAALGVCGGTDEQNDEVARLVSGWTGGRKGAEE